MDKPEPQAGTCSFSLKTRLAFSLPPIKTQSTLTHGDTGGPPDGESELMLETKIATMCATFSRIEPGEPPAAAFHRILMRQDGARKYVAMSVPIRDERLLAQAERDLRSGDEIEIMIKTRWAEEGIPKTLQNFAKVATSKGQVLLPTG